jgi:hypothetical protein
MTSALTISKLKLAKVAGAYNKYCANPVAGADKREAVLWLSVQVDAGKLSIDDINNAPDGSFGNAISVDTAKVDAIGAVASRSESVALDALAKANNLSSLIVDLRKKVKVLEGNTSAVDGDAVRSQVSTLIANAFAPFKQAVEDAGAQAVLADMTSAHVVETKTISEVFGVKVIDSRFKEMTVDLMVSTYGLAVLRVLVRAQSQSNSAHALVAITSELTSTSIRPQKSTSGLSGLRAGTLCSNLKTSLWAIHALAR